jgi:hypothetical protein
LHNHPDKIIFKGHQMRRYLKFIGIFTLFMVLSGCSADTLDELRNNATGPAPGQTDIPNNGGVGGGPG